MISSDSFFKASIRSRVLFFGLLLLVAIEGCYVKVPSYPDEWPSLVPLHDIEDELAGSFNCFGIALNSEPDPAESLLNIFSIEISDSLWCDKVEIARTADGLRFRFFDNDLMIQESNFLKNGDYKIENGWVQIKPVSSMHSGAGVVLVGSRTSNLTINTANELIVKATGSATGLVLLIPVVATGTDWVRFKRTGNIRQSRDCQQSDTVADEIYAAQIASNKVGRPSEVQELIQRAETISRPPLCDNEEAKVLTNKARRLILEHNQ